MADVRRIDVNALLELAANRSRDARAELMTAIVDLFLPAGQRLTDQQRALMTDVLGRLLTQIEVEVRQHLVAALLKSSVALPDLEAQLANDTIEVARPILEKSTVIRDRDLLEVVMQCAEEHRMAIALRHSLSAPIAEALVEQGIRNGEDDVLETLIRNEDATLSRRAMELLVAESKRNGDLQQPLLTRHDLPADLAHQMYWWVSAGLRRHILRNFVVDQAVLDPLIERATKRALVDHDDTQSLRGRALLLARRMDELGELTDSFLQRTLRQGRMTLFAAGLAVRARVAFVTAWKIIADKGHDSFIVLAKAMEISRDATASMVLVLDGLNNAAVARPASMLTEILKLYDDLDIAAARRVLQYWQLDTDFRDAIDAVAAEATG